VLPYLRLCARVRIPRTVGKAGMQPDDLGVRHTLGKRLAEGVRNPKATALCIGI
jgi:hypothetical protein